MLRTTICLAVVLGTLASPAMARREEPTVVQYADLDLTTPDGQAELDSRIDRAVRSFCKADDWVDAQVYFQSKRCLKVARVRVEEQRKAVIANAINNPTVLNIVLKRSTPRLAITPNRVAR